MAKLCSLRTKEQTKDTLVPHYGRAPNPFGGGGRYKGVLDDGAPEPFEVYCRFVGRTRGSSSSSPLEVRSITWGRGLFALTVLDSLDMINDAGPWDGCPLGVPFVLGVPILILPPDFVISIKSSSESSPPLLNRDEE